MMAVGLSEDAVLPYLAKINANSVVVACINAPNNVTLSGDETSIDQLEKMISDDGIFVRKLRVKTAYHSHHMTAIAEDYLAAIGSVQSLPSAASSGVTMFSSVTATPIVAEDLDGNYWIKNMVSTVRFSEAVKALITQSAGGKTRRKVAVSYAAAIEIGPSDALKGPVMQIFTATDERLVTSITYTSMLLRFVNAEVSAMSAAGKLWGQGISIDLHAVNFQSSPTQAHQSLANLPPYPWNHNKGYWHSSAWGKAYRFLRKPRTDLLGLRLQNQDPTEPRWHNFLRLSEQPWIADHRVQQMILYPGAAMITMAIQAACEMLDQSRKFKGVEARNVLFKRPVLVPSGDVAVETAIHLRPLSDGQYSFRIFSQADDQEWEENCSGSVSIQYDDGQTHAELSSWERDTSLFSMVRKRATRKIAPRTFYKFFDKKMNLQYGPLHQNVTECVAGFSEGYGKITVPNTKEVMPSQFEYPHLIHPATLDSIFHMQALGYLHTLSGDESLVPISIESVYISADISTKAGSELIGYAKSEKTDIGDFTGDIVLSDAAWLSPKAVVRGFLSRDTSATIMDNSAVARQPRKCTTLQWIDFNNFNLESNSNSNQDTVQRTKLDTTSVPNIVILCGWNPSLAVNQLVEKLTKVIESLNWAVRITKVSELGIEALPGAVLSLIEAEEPAVSRWTEADLKMFKRVITQTTNMLWVTRGGTYDSEESLQFSLTTGLLRTIRSEMPQLRLPHLDLCRKSALAHEQNIDAILKALESSILSQSAVYEQEFIVRDNKLLVPRLGHQESFHAELSSRLAKQEPYETRLADLDDPVEGSLAKGSSEVVWSYSDSSQLFLGEFDLEIRISAVNIEVGDLEMTGVLGRDAIGTVTNLGSSATAFKVGDNVVVCAFHTLKTTLQVHQGLVRHVPAFVDPNMVVTLPTALCTAQAVFRDIARLQEGETVLIAGNLGSVEQALISLATQLGAEVFVVAQSIDHERILVEHIGIEEDHILMSNPKCSYASTLGNIPGGKEVEVVVTTLTGNLLREAMDCLCEFGRFISIGTNSPNTNSTALPKNISIANFDLEQMRTDSPSKVARLFEQSWSRAEKIGLPLTAPSRSFPLVKIGRALIHLKSGRCFGSAVLKLAPDHQIVIPSPPPKQLRLDPVATYVLCGGLGGVGRSIADMMFEAGARNITFISRSGANSDDAHHLVESLMIRGCNARAFQCDVTDPAQVQEFAARCAEEGESIKGVVQCAMVLRDSMFENMTYSQWEQATQPKVQGSWNLHKYMPANLDFFIMLSSMAGVIGNPGQANYSAAGTFQDALSQYRRSQNLACTTIDLGIVADVGYIAENPEQFERLDYLENLFISERDLHIMLRAAMLGQTRDGVPVPAQVITGVGKELLAEGSLGFAMSADLKYAKLHESLQRGGGAVDSSEDAMIKENLKGAMSVRDASKVVEGVLSSQLARALNMEVADVDLEKPMHAFGGECIPYRPMHDDAGEHQLTSCSRLIGGGRGQEHDLPAHGC
jgi:NADPH:quinone reductase-like Zn-dependent oxidoreductase/NAD(P)-dependent dehydrogenase (short-subunit alcohol dehydrogenase family)/malonyl CoA-acyl carrier protein transacylase